MVKLIPYKIFFSKGSTVENFWSYTSHPYINMVTFLGYFDDYTENETTGSWDT